jgi:methyl-accepting chemotaxis protein
VVADEVRKLSERTARATEEAANAISKVQYLISENLKALLHKSGLAPSGRMTA